MADKQLGYVVRDSRCFKLILKGFPPKHVSQISSTMVLSCVHVDMDMFALVKICWHAADGFKNSNFACLNFSSCTDMSTLMIDFCAVSSSFFTHVHLCNQFVLCISMFTNSFNSFNTDQRILQP